VVSVCDASLYGGRGDCIPFFFMPFTTVDAEATGASALTSADMFVVVRADLMGDG
jgi:hypothetical protein